MGNPQSQHVNEFLKSVPDMKICNELSSWSTNKIGGKADWIKQDVGSPLCVQCKQSLSLAVQIYCPLNGSRYHRTLYVFCCINKSCWTVSKTWYILRMQSTQEKDAQGKASKVKSDKMFDSWGENDDDWGADNNSSEWDFGKGDFQAENSQVNVFTQKLESLRLNDKNSSLVLSKSDQNHVFPSHYINVFDESDCNWASNDSEHIKSLIEKYNKQEKVECGSSCGFNVSKGEFYEKDDVKDKLFHKFWKKLKPCSSQVIRYSLNGSPVLFTNPPDLISKCPSCGADRRFEFQLMPALVSYLQISAKDSERIEFGTVLFYTCSNSCWNDDNDAPIQEYSVYFPDPDLKYFKSHVR